MDDFITLKQRLIALNERERNWFLYFPSRKGELLKARYGKFDYPWEQVPPREREDIEREARARLEKRYGAEPTWEGEIRPLFGAVCSFYLAATPEQRVELRDALGACRQIIPFILWEMWHAHEELSQTKDPAWLRLALAAASLENCNCDFRDTTLFLAKLYTTAQELGLDVNHYFEAVAQISDATTTAEDHPSMQDMLRVNMQT